MKNTFTLNARSFGLKLTAILFTLLLISGLSWGQVSLPHFDPINYTVGQGLQTQTGWTSLNSGDALLIASGNLTYAGLPASTGNKVTYDGAGIDAAKLFTQQTSGTVYYSFLLNITSLGTLNTTGGYFTGFNEGTSTLYGATVWTRKDVGGTGYNIGINPRTTAANTVWVAGVQSLNSTLLVVISYQMISSTGNDIVKIWINPTPGASEPTANATATNTGGIDLLNVNRILIRQDGTSATPFIEMDELRIGTNWSDVAPGITNPSPNLTATTSPTSVDNNFTVTYLSDPAYQSAISAGNIKIGTATLSYGTDYTLSGNNTITFTPSIGGNISLRTPGTYTITVNASGYSPATVSQQLTAGVPTSNSTATINLPLAPGTARTITCTAKDQYNNLVSGYTFNYDVTITNNNLTFTEQYGIDGNAFTITTYDISVSATTDANGVATFFAELPFNIDGGDGISIQVQLNDGTTNIGPLFSFIQMIPQVITFGALTPVIYGDAPFTVSATGGLSGNPVTFTSSDNSVATCTGTNGEIITIIGYGTCTITASQAGNSNYNDAIPVSQTLVVNKKELTVPDAVAQPKTYTGTPDAVITGTLTGIVGSDAVTFNGTGLFASVNVGTSISVSSTWTLVGAKSVNYYLNQRTDLFADITQATQTITFAALPNKEIIAAPFNLTATASSLLPVSYTSSDPNVATILGNVVTIVGLGTTTITASQIGDGNFLPAADVQQPFTVVHEVIVAWQFGNPASLGDEYTYNATTNNAMLNTSVLSRGAGIHYTQSARTFNADQWETSALETDAVTNNKYFQFTINAKPMHVFSLATLNVKLKRSPTGPTYYIWKYSTDGIHFAAIGSPTNFTSTAGDGVVQPQIDLSGIPALQNVTDATTITFRLYAWNASGTGGTFSIGRYAALATTNSLAISGEALCPTAATPVFALGATSSRCMGAESVSYSASSANSYSLTYSLDAASLAANNTIVANTGVVTYNPTWTGTSVITVLATGCNGNATASHTVTINATASTVSITPSSATICEGDILTLEASGGLVYSQNVVLLDENFNGTGIPAGWIPINNSTGGIPENAAWLQQPDGYSYNGVFHGVGNSSFVFSNSDAQGGGTTATILKSPSFSTVGYSSATLSYYHYFYGADQLTGVVEWSADGSTWHNLKTYIPTAWIGAPNNFQLDNATLPSGALGQGTVWVRFKLDGDFGFGWALDNVKVEGTLTPNNITWTPTTGLYSDPGASTDYVLNTPAYTVYAKPNLTTTYTATANAGSACSNSASATITVNSLPIATFSYSGTPYCSNATNPSPSYGPGGGPGTFTTSPAGLSINPNTGQVNLSDSPAGTFTVTNSFLPAGGCPAVTASSQIVITTLPTASISYTAPAFCKTETSALVTLNGTGAYTGGTYSAASGLSINALGTIDPSSSTAGNYTVTYMTLASGGCAAVTATTSVSITAMLVATFNYANTPYCSNGTDPLPTFTGGGTAGTFTSDPGLSINATSGLVSLSLSAAGDYTVTNTIDPIGGCPQVVETSTIKITSLPAVTISYASAAFCISETSALVDLNGTGAYMGGAYTVSPTGLSIDGGSGEINPSLSTAGPYAVTYMTPALGGCATVMANTDVAITALPVATFSYIPDTYLTTDLDPSPTYSGGGVAGTFTSLPAGLVFIGTAGQIDLSASIPGAYTVTNFIAASGGCANVTETATITINAPLHKTLTVKVFVQGLYQGGGMMHEAYDFDGIDQFPPKWAPDIADTVTVELYNDTYGSKVARYAGVNLSTSGYLTIPTVNASLGGSYYITIFQRNSLPITTASAQSFAGSTINYDFTYPIDQAYGSGLAPQKDLSDGFYGMYTGALDQINDPDYVIDVTDLNILEPVVNVGPFGYLDADLDGSGFVDVTDLNLLEPNVNIGPRFWNPLLFAKKKHSLKIQNK
jgi:hypothetical protein